MPPPYVQQCHQCGVTLRDDRPRKFCSLTCSGAYRKRNRPTLICKRCGSSFTVQRSWADRTRYCSKACAHPIVTRADDIRRWYVDEKLTSIDIAERLGVASPSVRKVLRDLGISRDLSEAQKLVWERRPVEDRNRIYAAAHEAARAKRYTETERLDNAVAKAIHRSNIGPHEVTFARLLNERDIYYAQQFPCGPYNLDFALTEFGVAVEIVAGGGNARVRANAPQRLERVLYAWHLVEVKFQTPVPRVIRPAVVDQLVAFCDEVAGLPTGPGQHRMIRTDGQLIRPRGRRKAKTVEVA